MPTATVVQVIPHDRPGGMQQVAAELDAGFPDHGIASSVLNLADWTAGSGPSIGRLVLGWFRLVGRLRREQPTAVLAHSVKNAVYCLSAARAAGVGRRVLVIHGERRGMGRAKTAMIEITCRLGWASTVVCCGHSVRASYAKLGSAVQRRMQVITNGVRLPETVPSSPHPRPAGEATPLRLIVACRLDPDKDLPTAIAAVSTACVPVHLTVCGAGESADQLARLVEQHRAPVELVGHLGRSELANRYADSDLFIFPTRHEGLPLVLIEAAAAGLPVIASDIPANREVLGDAARYCPVGDVSAFRSAIEELAADPARRAAMRDIGLQRVEQFTVSRMLTDYARLLTQDRTAHES